MCTNFRVTLLLKLQGMSPNKQNNEGCMYQIYYYIRYNSLAMRVTVSLSMWESQPSPAMLSTVLLNPYFKSNSSVQSLK